MNDEEKLDRVRQSQLDECAESAWNPSASERDNLLYEICKLKKRIDNLRNGVWDDEDWEYKRRFMEGRENGKKSQSEKTETKT